MKRYEEPTIEIVLLSSEDVITTSAFDGTDDGIEDWDSPTRGTDQKLNIFRKNREDLPTAFLLCFFISVLTAKMQKNV